MSEQAIKDEILASKLTQADQVFLYLISPDYINTTTPPDITIDKEIVNPGGWALEQNFVTLLSVIGVSPPIVHGQFISIMDGFVSQYDVADQDGKNALNKVQGQLLGLLIMLERSSVDIYATHLGDQTYDQAQPVIPGPSLWEQHMPGISPTLSKVRDLM